MLDESIKKSLPHALVPELIPWISMSWVFKMPEEFKHVTRIAMLDSKTKIGEGSEPCMYEGVDIPIPDVIISKKYNEWYKPLRTLLKIPADEIQHSRLQALSRVFLAVDTTIKEYHGPQIKCSSNFGVTHPLKVKNSACDAIR